MAIRAMNTQVPDFMKLEKWEKFEICHFRDMGRDGSLNLTQENRR